MKCIFCGIREGKILWDYLGNKVCWYCFNWQMEERRRKL